MTAEDAIGRVTDPESAAAVCTIVAKNYTAFARTLAVSIAERAPGRRIFVLVVDDWRGFIDPESEPFEIVPIEALEIPDFPSFAFKYNLTELCTAAKPFFLEYLFAKAGVQRLIYLDPDILVTGDLAGIEAGLDRHDLLLTPHIEHDYPDDGLFPSDSQILRCGIYNLGFVALRDSDRSKEILRWWQGKVYDHCVFDRLRGYYVDQRFFDLAVGFFEGIGILRDPCWNVAYWNLHSRKVERSGESWFCNGQEMQFFHFSSFRPSGGADLAGFGDRIDLTEEADLLELIEIYRSRILSNGYQESRGWPYTFDFFVDGKRIPDTLRRLFKSSTRSTSNPFVRTELPLRLRWARLPAALWDGLRRSTIRALKRSRLLAPALRRAWGPFQGI